MKKTKLHKPRSASISDCLQLPDTWQQTDEKTVVKGWKGTSKRNRANKNKYLH